MTVASDVLLMARQESVHDPCAGTKKNKPFDQTTMKQAQTENSKGGRLFLAKKKPRGRDRRHCAQDAFRPFDQNHHLMVVCGVPDTFVP